MPRGFETCLGGAHRTLLKWQGGVPGGFKECLGRAPKTLGTWLGLASNGFEVCLRGVLWTLETWLGRARRGFEIFQGEVPRIIESWVGIAPKGLKHDYIEHLGLLGYCYMECLEVLIHALVKNLELFQQVKEKYVVLSIPISAKYYGHLTKAYKGMLSSEGIIYSNMHSLTIYVV